jgi:hypothetical protein
LLADSATSDAWVPWPVTNQIVKPTTRAPASAGSVPSPRLTTRPARSQPGVYGAAVPGGKRGTAAPVTIPRSAGLMVAASVLMSTSPAPGAGSAASANRTYSTPNWATWTARNFLLRSGVKSATLLTLV